MFRQRLAESARAFRAAFANRSVRRLELAFAGSCIGDWAFIIALSVYAYGQGGAAAVGIVALVRSLAGAVAAPFASVLADRYPRRAVMIASDLASAIGVTGCAVLVATDGPPLALYALSLTPLVAGTAFQPAQTAMLPSLTRTPEELTAANVATSTIDSAAMFVGPALGAALLAVTGTATVFLADALTFIWSVALVVRIPSRPAPEVPVAEPDETAEPEGFWRELTAGIRTIAGDARLRVLIGLFGVQTLVSGVLTVLIVVMALDLLDIGSSGVGALNAAMGVGGLLGSLTAFALIGRGRLASDFALGLLAWGIPIALIALVASPPFALVMLAVLGIGNTLVDVAGLTLLQRVVPDQVLGRVLGALESVFVASFGIGAALAPVLIDVLGTRGALAVTGAILPVCAVLAWPVLRSLDRETGEPERASLLRSVPFLAVLPDPAIERLARLLDPVPVTPGEVVVAEGEPGDRFYVVEEGRFEVAAHGRVVSSVGPGDYFGEIALVRNVPRTATVKALTEGRLLALDRDEFVAAVTGHAPSAEAADAVVRLRLGGVRAALGNG
jgi:MFS family permease